MAANRRTLVSDYLVVMRIIQPARIQDVKRMMPRILGMEMDDDLSAQLDVVHAKLREDARLIAVRRGTYILDQQGMAIAAKLLKERNLDNARIFLMKDQRKAYRKTVCPFLPVRWLALHCTFEGCSDGLSRSSSQEDEPWQIIEKHLSESMLPN